MFGGINILDHLHIVEGLAAAVPSSSVPDYVNMKNAKALAVVVHYKNATTVTGSAITLKQASDASATGEKALSLPFYYKVNDNAAADAPWTKVAAVSDTFTTDATNSKNGYYVIPVDPSTLDHDNGFTYLRAGTGNATAATIDVTYLIVPENPAGNPTLLTPFIA